MTTRRHRPHPARGARAAVAALLVALAACSGGDEQAAPGTTTSPGADDLDRLGVTTTTFPTSPAARTVEDYVAAGAAPDAARCLVAARLERDLDVELPAEPGGSIVVRLLAEDPQATPEDLAPDAEPLLAFDADVATGAEVQRALLDALGAECLHAAGRQALAERLGAEDDAAALAEALPVELERRRGTGASDDELACLEAGYRAAPARLASLAADRRVVEADCITAPRREMMRRAGIARGLTEAGATDEERDCLVVDDADLAVLADTMAAALGGIGEVPTDDAVRCTTGQRLGEIAVGALAREVDFGGEDLLAAPVVGASSPGR